MQWSSDFPKQEGRYVHRGSFRGIILVDVKSFDYGEEGFLLLVCNPGWDLRWDVSKFGGEWIGPLPD